MKLTTLALLALATLALVAATPARAQDASRRDRILERLRELDAERTRLLEELAREDDAGVPDAEVPTPPARAVPRSTELQDAIVVVAKRFASPERRATASVTSFDRSDIERRQATSVADVLREAAGVYALRDGPRGQTSRVFTRGAASNQTLVLVDGIPQNDATGGGGFDFNDFGTDAVERVEVLRGSYGVLYGSEAIGGVISVTTRRGGGPARGFVRVEGGSFDTHREVVGVSGGDDRFDAALTVGTLRSKGERDREAFRTSEWTGRVGMLLTPRARLETSLRYVDSEVESPFDFATTGVLPEDPNTRRTRHIKRFVGHLNGPDLAADVITIQ